MESADEGRQRIDAQQLFDALTHLRSRLVGEGDRGDGARVDPLTAHQPGHTIGE